MPDTNDEVIKKCTLKYRRALRTEYKSIMRDTINNSDPESGHYACDNVLCDLLCALGFSDIVELYNMQEKWYA